MTTTQTNPATEATGTKIHVFEKAGLGKAPFRCVAVERRVGPIVSEVGGCRLEVGAPGQPMGTCDFCGTGIADCFVIRSADQKEFVVGCDCVAKTGDSGLKRVVSEHKRQVNRAKRAAQIERESARIEAVKAKISDPAVREKLAAIPHGKDWKGNQRFLLGSAEWYFQNAGHSGQLGMARIIEKTLAE